MKLTRIKLINWHAFENKTIATNGNFAITGENGSGKSTLIDALYYVLSGGDKNYFNHAANSDAERTLETYILFKTGAEKQAYLRERPTICHIALEFSDESGYPSILGVVVDVGETGTVEHFYTAIGHSIEDSFFLDEHRLPRSFDGIVETLGAVPIKDKGARSRRQLLICQDFFHLSGRNRYMTLLKKALAFRPIDEVSSFVNDFLLEDIPINIADLQNELQSYNEIYQTVKRTENKINALERFMPQARTYVELSLKSKFLAPLEKEADCFMQRESAQSCRNKISELESRCDSLRMKVESNRMVEMRQRGELADLEMDDMLRAVRQAERERDEIGAKLVVAKAQVEKATALLSSEQKLVKHFGKSYVFLSDVTDDNFSLFVRHRADWKDFLFRMRTDLYEQKSTWSVALGENTASQREISREIEDLKSHHNHYRPAVEKVRKLLEEHLEKQGLKCTVRPLCEYLEVKESEEAWSDALEAYLGEDRFGLVLSPQLYGEGVRYLSSLRDPELSGVRIFNAKGDSFLPPSFSEGSLGAKLDVSDKYAKWVCHHLLASVGCVDDLKDVSADGSAVTKGCAIYRSWHFEQADAQSYAYPYIGEASFQKRQEVLVKSLEKLKREESEIRSSLMNVQADISLVEQSRITEVMAVENVWLLVRGYEVQAREIQETIDRYAASPDIFAKMERIDELKAQIASLRRAIGEDERMVGKLQQEEGALSSQASSLEEQASMNEKEGGLLVAQLEEKIAYEELRRAYQGKDGFDAERIHKEAKEANAHMASLSGPLKSQLQSYQANFNPNISTSLEDVGEVIHEYERLVKTEIVKYALKAEEARLHCEQQFRDSFIAKLNENIRSARREIKGLNDVLAGHPFGVNQERYKFLCNPPKDDEMREYYRIITSGKVLESQSLFEEVLDAKDQDIINQLFDRISHPADSQEAQRMLERYTDYRSYMTYDIEITRMSEPDNPVLFSKTRREKSGGETQTPFYIIIAACFDKLIARNREWESTCPIIFDEAFNNMDETRINELLSYYKELGIQVAIVIPTNRAPSVTPFMDTVVGLCCIASQIDILYVHKDFEVGER